jgi:hypothetical protein
LVALLLIASTATATATATASASSRDLAPAWTAHTLASGVIEPSWVRVSDGVLTARGLSGCLRRRSARARQRSSVTGRSA